MQALEKSLAFSSSVERHHQARLIRRAAEAHDPQAERPPPPVRRCPDAPGMLEGRRPDERAIGKDMQRAGRAERKELLQMCFVVFFREDFCAGFIADVVDLPVNALDQLFREPQPHRLIAILCHWAESLPPLERHVNGGATASKA